MSIPGIILHANSQAQLDAFAGAPSHAALLSGPKGTGKTWVAATLSAQLLGVRLDELIHQAQYRVIVPKNNTIGVEQVRELTNFFRLKVPGTAAIKRVAILQDAETMSVEAQNALLKLLEEPPADSVLLLTSSHPVQLLATIRSRVQQLQLPAPADADVLRYFVEAGYPEAAVKAALLRTGTNIAEAQRTLQTDNDSSAAAITLVKQALSASSYERLLLVDALAKQKEQSHLFTDTLAMVAAASLEVAAVKGASTLHRWRNILQSAYTAQEALERSGNAKLVLTELMLAL